MPKRRTKKLDHGIPGPSASFQQKPTSLLSKIGSCVYDKETNEILGRTCKGWVQIICYSIMYLIFLSTFTLIFLYIALMVIKENPRPSVEKVQLLTYEDDGIGLSAIPALHDRSSLISYQKGNSKEYQPYVEFLDSYFDNNKYRNKRETCISNLGPCGCPPYGYDEAPCVFLRINKQVGWSAEPLTPGTEAANNAPPEVQKWLEAEKKLWIYCHGAQSWDKEHVGEIKYYPNPPGIDPSLFPQNMSSRSQLIAVQFTKFTLGIMLNIKCKLYYNLGTSSLSLNLYVAHDNAHRSRVML